MAWEAIFPFLGRCLRKPSIITEYSGNPTHCKVQAFPVEHFFFFQFQLFTESTEFRSFVPVKFIQCIQVPEVETISAPACYYFLLDLILTDTAGTTNEVLKYSKAA